MPRQLKLALMERARRAGWRGRSYRKAKQFLHRQSMQDPDRKPRKRVKLIVRVSPHAWPSYNGPKPSGGPVGVARVERAAAKRQRKALRRMWESSR